MMCAVFSTVAFSEEQSDYKYQADLKEAVEIIDMIYGGEFLAKSDSVSRGTFIKKLFEITKNTAIKPEKFYFKDVKAITDNSAEIYTAAEFGWISKGESFEPDREIAGYEATKILVSLMGYSAMADARGGYPMGYVSLAESTEIDKNVDLTKNILSSDDVYMLVFNTITTPLPKQNKVSEKISYEQGFDDILYIMYKIRFLEGKVTATPYNNLRGEEPDEKRDIAGIDGTNYKCEIASWDDLGKRVRAYIDFSEDEDGKIVYKRELSYTKTLKLSDITGKDGNSVSYSYDDGRKEKSLRLNAGATVIFNGRKVTENISSYFTEATGEAVFVYDERYDTCDTVYINRYDYLYVHNTDLLAETVSDVNSSENLIEFQNGLYIVEDQNGNEMDWKGISAGEVLRIIRSEDKKFVYLKKITGKVSGKVTSISDKITIEDKEYEMSSYFKKYYLSKFNSAYSVSVITDGDILVSFEGISTAMQYGYMTDLMYEGSLDDKYKAKIYDTSGEFNKYYFADKITVDGEGGKTAGVVNTLFANTPQLIRFGLDSNGEIKHIDFASGDIPETPGVFDDDKNVLTSYDYLTGKILYYRNKAGVLGGFCSVNSAVMFCIPEDVDNEEGYAIRTRVNGTIGEGSYNDAVVYDLNEYGEAGAVVVKRESSYEISIYPEPMLVKSVYMGLNDKGEKRYIIYGWQNKAFKTVYLDPAKSADYVKKSSAKGEVVNSSHPLLSGGDIIHISTDANNEIRNKIQVVFDARKGVFASTDYGNFNKDDGFRAMYYGGVVYTNSPDSGFAGISIGDNAWSFLPENLRYLSTNASMSIVQYNARTGEVRPLEKTDIKSYKHNGEKAHFAIFYQDSFDTKNVILYEETEGRR